MSTKYNKVVATIDGNTEVIYVTNSELERCRNRVGKEGCEDASISTVTVSRGDLKLWSRNKNSNDLCVVYTHTDAGPQALKI